MVSRSPREEPEAPVTPSRALRIALTRAAERAAGLTATALGVSDDMLALPDLLARLEDGWLFLRLDGGEEAGLFAIDPGLVAAAIEMQMRGRLSEGDADPRPLTSADAALVAPLATAFLSELGPAARDSALAGWAAERTVGDRLADLRAIGLVLPEGGFRVVGVSAWLGAGDRQGQVLVAVPEPVRADPARDPAHRAALWSATLRDNVLSASATVEAVLHRLRLPLSEVQGFEIGRQIPLPGVRVTSVRIEGPGGRLIGRGRLGQTGGMRAVRIEEEPPPELADRPAVPGPARVTAG